MEFKKPGQIIVLRGGALGDCVITSAALNILRRHYPESQITVLGDPYSAAVYHGLPSIDRLVIAGHRRRKLRYLAELRSLRQHRFDLLLDFQTCGRSRVQTALLAAKRRIGFDKGHWLGNLPYSELVPYDSTAHAVVRTTSLMRPLGIEYGDQDLEPTLPVVEKHFDEATRLLRGVSKEYAVLQATCGPREGYRLWPPERFAAVASHLVSRGIEVVLSSATSDSVVVQVLEMSPAGVRDLSGATDPLVLAAILQGARLYVGYNTGPMHVAAAVGTPIVALFDVPQDATEWRPWTHAPYCILQARKVKEKPGWRMDTVQVPEVAEAIDEVLRQGEHRLSFSLGQHS